MSTDLKALQTLDLKPLDLPQTLPVTDIEVEEFVDWTGDDALRVTLILDEAVDPTISGGDVIRLKAAIRDAIAARGAQRFAYIFLLKESERQQDSNQDRRHARRSARTSKATGAAGSQAAETGESSPRGVLNLLRRLSFPYDSGGQTC